MALAVEEGKLPLVLPASVNRVTADGLPTKHLIDWEQLTRHWYKANAVALDTRLTEVTSETEGNSAAIIEETTARTDADNALAIQITEVTATVDDATANGQIYFAAKAAPGGAVAAYGLYLTAGSTFTGMELIADSGGGASIAFAANDFKLTDSGTAQNVFNYTGGVFTFNVPVRVGTVDIANQAVTAPVAASNGSTVTIAGDNDWVSILSASATGVSGGVAVIYLDFVYLKFQPNGSGILGGEWRLRRSDGTVKASGTLQNVVDWFPVSISRLDTGFQSTFTYHLEVRCFVTVPPTGGGSPYFQIDIRNLMIDMRKR